jgi:hypothetical protein
MNEWLTTTEGNTHCRGRSGPESDGRRFDGLFKPQVLVRLRMVENLPYFKVYKFPLSCPSISRRDQLSLCALHPTTSYPAVNSRFGNPKSIKNIPHSEALRLVGCALVPLVVFRLT